VDGEAGHSAAEEFVVAVPFEVLLCRPVGGVCREGDFPVFHACEQVGGFAGFGEMPFGDEDGVVVTDGPQAVVEQPVGVFGKGDAVVLVVIAAPGELVDMGGVHDGVSPVNVRKSNLTPPFLVTPPFLTPLLAFLSNL
jgi:hypothetical protein